MNFDLRDRTVFLTLAGSRSFGTETEDSDWDYRGIAIPPLKNYINLEPKFEQSVDTEHKWMHDLFKNDVPAFGEFQIYEISKFIKLALENNPSIIEIIFSEKSDIYLQDPIMKLFLDNKEKLLSKQCKSRYIGFSLSMLKKMERHKRWLGINKPTHKPIREEFDLPSYNIISRDQIQAAWSMIDYECNCYIIEQTHLPEDLKIDLKFKMPDILKKTWDKYNSAVDFPVGKNKLHEHHQDLLEDEICKELNFSESMLEVLRKERKYRSALKDWNSYQTWLVQRNPKRASLEEKLTYDPKNLMHLCRLVRSCKEILTEKTLHVRRADAEELKEIRNGAWTYDQAIEYMNKMDDEINQLYDKSDLPKVPDFKFFNELIENAIIEYNDRKKNSK